MRVLMISPAKHIGHDLLDAGKVQLEQAGCKVSFASHVKGGHHNFAGTTEERFSDLQTALNAKDVAVILCSRGGYGTMDLLAKGEIDFTQYGHYPKWVVGFSDIGFLHNQLIKLNFPCIHGIMPMTFKENTAEAWTSLMNGLYGRANQYSMPAHAQNRIGGVTAPVVGGNLSILSATMGTFLELDVREKILFIEEVNEPLYRINRMLQQFKMAKKLEQLAGLIVGGITHIQETVPPYGVAVEKLILDVVASYRFPVCFGFPAGHIEDNRAIILNHDATLDVRDTGTCFTQQPCTWLQEHSSKASNSNMMSMIFK